ncbi:YeeE/YedE thiosulfate transporter family protein [Phosphitispora fastidiosa]|uniref:YeeE/YedE thiosulfate transporter family protein n=1 Tax=Phosphitispora fastidiosa TaxID=2837202 RepID=UPI001E58AA5A|nr:YeeE/YedE thiosulfate transporter family protein [Phosphitispora fastidiosa]MBU7006935.1 putative membrane protein YedE/YeeE [Phosphitispora fastidiosa]
MNGKNAKSDRDWYIGGALLGLVVVFSFFTGHPVGTATTYERITGHILRFFSPEYVTSTVHYFKEAAPVAEWQTLFVIGMLLSGVIGRFLFVKRKGEDVPEMWAEVFGSSTAKRFVVSFIGGFLLLFGSRLAGGCTSGLFISGGSQLAIAALIFAGAMFASGIVTAKLLFKGRD